MPGMGSPYLRRCCCCPAGLPIYARHGLIIAVPVFMPGTTPGIPTIINTITATAVSVDTRSDTGYQIPSKI